MVKNRRGFTLVELIVTMAVFIFVIVISGNSFNTILTHTSKLFKSEESNMEGSLGLEILRHDIQQSGYGLYSDQNAINYNEATAAPANTYNDSPNNVPRPILAGNNIAAVTDTSGDSGSPKFDLLPGTDYLVIRGTTLARNSASQKWTYLHYTSNDVYPNNWPSAAENFDTNDRVVLLRRQLTPTSQGVSLENDTNGDFYFAFSSTAFSHMTSASTSMFTVYGLDSNGVTPRMPFNRSDYFIARPQTLSQISPTCATGTGILYKTTLNHGNGKLNYVPILDCVADMQIVFGWDINGDNVIDTYSNADGTQASGTGSATDVHTAISQASNNSSSTTPNIRYSLKMIKIYILAQQGKRDPNYTSPSPIIVGDIGETSLTKSFDVSAAGLTNYRWKLYKIIARPKNLPSNQ